MFDINNTEVLYCIWAFFVNYVKLSLSYFIYVSFTAARARDRQPSPSLHGDGERYLTPALAAAKETNFTYIGYRILVLIIVFILITCLLDKVLIL